MNKHWLALATATALLLGGYFVASTMGQFGGNAREIDLLPPTVLLNPRATTLVTVGPAAPRPRGVDVKVNKRLLGVVQVNTVPSSGTLDVYFQSSPDCGMCWQDFAHVSVTAAGTYYVPLSLGQDAPWPTTVPAMQDGTLGSGQISQWGICDRLRAKYQATFAVSSTGSWSFHVYVIPD
jgi:hypothetical protein